MTQIISHEISKFGRLDVALHSKSLSFYNILNEKGIITDLKNLDHLGFISKSHPGNNHKRWDYVILQLYILHKIKDEVFRTGLSSQQSITPTSKESGIVILQIAILFANIGHLIGTVSSEKVVFEYLIRNNICQDDFLGEIKKEKEWGSFIKRVFKENDYYKTKYLIGLNFIYKHVNDQTIKDIILKFFKDPLTTDTTNFRKLKWIFFKVRQISFVYLDSFNSDFSFQIDISKILLNTNNYKSLFNPNSNDYESFFDACETSLVKKLYISPKSASSFFNNWLRFHDYFKKECLTGSNKIDFKDFLLSYRDKKRRDFEIVEPQNILNLQFYISREDIKIFGFSNEVFNHNDALNQLYEEEQNLNKILNKKLSKKSHRVCIIHDQRKTLYYNNLLIVNEELLANEFNNFILNYLNLHLVFLGCFKYQLPVKDWESIATNNLYKHYTRKIFLQFYKVLFKFSYDLSAFIKFDRQDLIQKITEVENDFQPTGYIKSKSNFLKMIKQLISNKEIPKEIVNNFKLAEYIIENDTEIKNNVNIFYCLLPVEIDSYELDPKKLYDQKNPESAKTITDIDLTIAIFNKSKFELYFIEGKNVQKGYAAAVESDFNNRIKPNLRDQSLMPAIKTLYKNGAKGGYIKFSN